jgi:hypothetical protein
VRVLVAQFVEVGADDPMLRRRSSVEVTKKMRMAPVSRHSPPFGSTMSHAAGAPDAQLLVGCGGERPESPIVAGYELVIRDSTAPLAAPGVGHGGELVVGRSARIGHGAERGPTTLVRCGGRAERRSGADA